MALKSLWWFCVGGIHGSDAMLLTSSCEKNMLKMIEIRELSFSFQFGREVRRVRPGSPSAVGQGEGRARGQGWAEPARPRFHHCGGLSSTSGQGEGEATLPQFLSHGMLLLSSALAVESLSSLPPSCGSCCKLGSLARY